MSRPAVSSLCFGFLFRFSLSFVFFVLRSFAPSAFRPTSALLRPLLTAAGLSPCSSPWVSVIPFDAGRQTLPLTLWMTFGVRCCQPAHPCNRPLCLFVFLRSLLCFRPFRAVSSRSRPGLPLRLASPPPSGTFHPDSVHTCQAHWRRLSSLRVRATFLSPVPHPLLITPHRAGVAARALRFPAGEAMFPSLS